MGANNRLEGTVRSLEGDRVGLEVDGRLLHGRARGPVSVGTAAVGLIRLERLSAHAEPGPARIPMSLGESLFLGDHYELVFDWEAPSGGETRRLIRGVSRDGLTHGIWHVELPEEDLMIFPAD
jgi:hypothetical protein